MSRIIRNNKAYDSGDAVVTIGSIVTDLVEITYGTEQEHQVNHALGNDAKSWSKGKITHTATATFMVQDISPLEKAAGGSLLNIQPFFINVSLVNEYNEIVNDTLLVKFKNQGREVTGDMGLNKQYELFAMDIEYNNA